MTETGEDQVLGYASAAVARVQELKRSLQRMLLWGGVLVLLSGAGWLALDSDDWMSMVMGGVAVGSGLFSLWLRRAVRKENRVGIFCGTCVVWAMAVGFAVFMICELVVDSRDIPTISERLLMCGILGGLCFMMDLGLIGVA